jgi:hypothetical protein
VVPFPTSPTRPASTSRSALRVLVAIALSAAAIPVFGLVEPEPRSLDAFVKPAKWILDVPQADPNDASRVSLAIASFRSSAAGTWVTPIDRRTGRALLFEGSGIPMYPGAGNSLLRSDVAAGFYDEDGRPTLAAVETMAREFLAENADLFMPSKGELTLNKGRSGIYDDGRIAFADFDWTVAGVPVLGAHVFVRMNNGNLIQAGTHLVGDVDTPTAPVITASSAVARALAHAGLDGRNEDILDEGHLIILPIADSALTYEGPTGGGLAYRLAYEVAFRQKGQDPTWTARVDAMSGEVLEWFDANLYVAQVTGGVYPRTVTDPETVWPFFFTTVIGGGINATDLGGRLPNAAYDLSSGLDGKWFNTNCNTCTNPAQPAVSKTGGTGLLRFGTGGLDQTGNGLSSRADRNAFFHLNITRLVAKKWIANSYLEADYPANVNIPQSCNAFWNGSSVNFYRSSASCNNTGEIADVMQHEWGHGLDFATAGGDGATSEATADINAMHASHSALVGPYFNKNGNPVRNLDRFTTSKGLLTVGNIPSKCGGGSGPLGFEVHCEGEIYGQTSWDLATALVAKYGTATGWRTSEHTYYTALPQSVIYLPNQAGSIYNAYLAADDDDGNLANGTPNGNEIYTAFNRHEIAGGSSVSTPHCARPAEPAVSATVSCGQIQLSWSAVPGATSYRVQRHFNSVPSPYLDLATVTPPTTTYIDTQVMQGVTYHYVVMAVNASGCESTINTDVPATIASRPRLDVTSATTNDNILGGNHSGTVDPGESVELSTVLQNAGSFFAVAIGNTLTSNTAGVTVTNATTAYSDLPADASSPSGTPYRISIAGSVSCGTLIDLSLNTTAVGVSCPLETNSIRVQTGTQTNVRANDSFETATWSLDAGNSTASTGGWTRGDPVGTTFQPDTDVSPSGVNAWYTGANPAGIDTTDDVDNGQTTLLSPVYNLTGLNTAWVVYWRWFGQRDLGDDASGDYYVLEVSNNGGSSWTAVETLGDGVNEPFWQLKRFRIDSLLSLTANMRFRIRVSDGPSNDDIIEAAIDDFQILEYTCDTTPPCFAGPTFAGLASAVATPGHCGEADLSWAGATSNCPGGSVSYNVYRSTTSGFTPSLANRVATGVVGSTFRDTVLTSGVTYYWIVRAVDSRSGEESNVVQRSAVAQAGGVDSSPPVFGGIQSAQAGSSCRESTLTWSPAADCMPTIVYEVYRGSDFFFTPDPSNLVAEVSGTSYTDVTPTPAATYTYIVRARDTSNNEETNSVRLQATSTVLPNTIVNQTFESGAQGWALGEINSATAGQWQLGNPVGTGAQPEDDTTPNPGVNCWATGLAGGGIDDNDVDDGATSIVSPVFNLAGVNGAIVKYNRWYSDDHGSNPDGDAFLIQVSNDGGESWNDMDSTSVSNNLWELRTISLAPILPSTASMRFQFIAQDQPDAPSTTEAAIDDFQVIDPQGGCSICGPQGPVGKILVTKSGMNTTLSWAADPVSAPKYLVYRALGTAFDQPIRIGSTSAKTFEHSGALLLPGSIFYLVSAVNTCGAESAINTP